MKKILIIAWFAHSLVAEQGFIVPERLKSDVDFWTRVYSEWDIHQVVFYDSKTKFVYDVLNLPRVENDLSSRKHRKLVEQRAKQISEILKTSSTNLNLVSNDAFKKSILDVVKKHGLNKEENLADGMRYQNGLRTQFESGLKISGRYADEMNAILRSQNLPEDLLAIVFVESLFNLSAVSHAGASGPWGFVKDTALSFGIFVNNFTDERLDPLVSTLAAARYLNKSKQGLSEWPLIITSYNYGYAGTMRAVNNLGTKDFSVILEQHQSPIFGYASQNYYAEFLAAREVLKSAHIYFPKVKKDPRWHYDTVEIKRPVEVLDVIASGAVNRDDLIRLNPALSSRTLRGQEVLPAKYVLRVPKGTQSQFYKRLEKVPAHKRNAASVKVSTKYVAKGRESLARIAKRFGISADTFAKKMGKPRTYQPKGSVLIRSEDHLFSPLLEINKDILSAMAAGVTVEKPPEIGTVAR